MKVALLDKPFSFVIKEEDKPRIGATEVLVKVVACGVCGTDVRAWEGKQPRTWTITYPYRMGHELAGVVEEVGEDVPDLKRGDRVVPDGRMVCGRCHYCRRGLYNLCMNQSYISGGFSEYAAYPYRNLVKIPDGVSLEHATLTEPLACCVNGNSKLDIPLGGVAVVIGDGPIGLLHAQLLKGEGMSVIMVGHHDHRLAAAKALGVHVTINAKKQDPMGSVRELTDGRGADVVVSAAGEDVSVLAQAIEMAAKGGQILYFAATREDQVTLDLDTIHYHELRLIGSHDSTIAHYQMALALLKSGAVQAGPLISHRFPLEQIGKAFEVARNREGIKVLVQHREEDWG